MGNSSSSIDDAKAGQSSQTKELSSVDYNVSTLPADTPSGVIDQLTESLVAMKPPSATKSKPSSHPSSPPSKAGMANTVTTTPGGTHRLQKRAKLTFGGSSPNSEASSEKGMQYNQVVQDGGAIGTSRKTQKINQPTTTTQGIFKYLLIHF